MGRQSRQYQLLWNGRAFPPSKQKSDQSWMIHLLSQKKKKKKEKKERKEKEKKKTFSPIPSCILFRSSVILLAKSPVAVTSYHDKSWNVTSDAKPGHIWNHTSNMAQSHQQYFEDLVSGLFKDSLEELGSYPQDLCSILPLVAWLSF